MRISALLSLLPTLTLIGCGDDGSNGGGGDGGADGSSGGSSPGGTAFTATLTGAPVELSDPSGNFIIHSDLGASYWIDMTGTNESIKVSLDGDGADGAPGTYSPFNLTVFWVEEQYSCGFSNVNQDGLQLSFVIDMHEPIAGSFEGDVECRPLEGQGGEFEAQIQGTYDDS